MKKRPIIPVMFLLMFSPAVVMALSLTGGGSSVVPDSLVNTDTIAGKGKDAPLNHLEVYSDNTTTPTRVALFNNYSGLNSSGGDYTIAQLSMGTSAYFSTLSGKIPNNYYGDGVRLDFTTSLTNNTADQAIRLSILPFSGQIGIGTTTPIRRFEVASDGVNWISGTYSGSGGSDKVVLGNIYNKATLGAHNEALDAWADLSLQPDGGNVGIGNPNPSEKLDINGNIKASGTITGHLNANNAVIVNAADPVNAQDAATKASITIRVSVTGDTLFFGPQQWIIMPGVSLANHRAVLSTSETDSITSLTALSGGTITDDGGAPVTQRGVCWGTLPNPTISGLHTHDGSGIGTFNSHLTGLTPNTHYYVRSYAITAVGTSYGNEMQFTSDIVIGDFAYGGLVFYFFGPDDPGYVEGEVHGMVVQPESPGGINWGCSGNMVYMTYSGIGHGASNTARILESCDERPIPASYCDNLVLNGYSDWFSPSLDELEQIYLNLYLNNTGNYSPNKYWSSTDATSYYANCKDFQTGNSHEEEKLYCLNILAVRNF